MTDETNDPSAKARRDASAQPIKGYRTLTLRDVDAINDIKRIEEYVAEQMRTLETEHALDPRSLALARTHVENGFMWLVKAIAKPMRP